MVGDFPEDDARKFLEGHCRLDDVTIASLRSTWHEVYQVRTLTNRMHKHLSGCS